MQIDTLKTDGASGALVSCGEVQWRPTRHPVIHKQAQHEIHLEAQQAQEYVELVQIVLSDTLAGPWTVVVDVDDALAAVLTVPGRHWTLDLALTAGHCPGLGRRLRFLRYHSGRCDGVYSRHLPVTIIVTRGLRTSGPILRNEQVPTALGLAILTSAFIPCGFTGWPYALGFSFFTTTII